MRVAYALLLIWLRLQRSAVHSQTTDYDDEDEENATGPNLYVIGELYGMQIYQRKVGYLPLSAPETLIPHFEVDSSFYLMGKDAKHVQSAFLDRYPTCASEIVRMYRNTSFTCDKMACIFEIYKEDVDAIQGWSYPMYFCPQPRARLWSFGVLTVDTENQNLVIVMMCFVMFTITLSALFTGLNLGIMSLEVDHLERIRELDPDPDMRKYAADITPLRKDGNFILCTIILGNTIANTLSTIMISAILNLTISDARTRDIMSTFVTSGLIMVFAEILPQVIITKHALRFGSKLRYLMVFFMVLTCIISWPLARLFDFLLGKEKGSDMRILISSLMKDKKRKDERPELANAMERALMMEKRMVKDAMTPIEKVFMLSDEKRIDAELKKVLSDGNHTRVPVYKGKHKNVVCGVLNVKDLLLVDERYCHKVGIVMQLWFRSTTFHYLAEDTLVPQVMMDLKMGCPMGIVMRMTLDDSYEVVGIVTLEDNMEEVIGEIYDEKDKTKGGRDGKNSEKQKARKKRKTDRDADPTAYATLLPPPSKPELTQNDESKYLPKKKESPAFRTCIDEDSSLISYGFTPSSAANFTTESDRSRTVIGTSPFPNSSPHAIVKQ